MFRLASSRERLDQDLVQLFASPLRQMKRCDVSCDHPRSQTIGMTIRDWLGLGINSFCPSFCCTLRCYSLLFLIGPIDVFLSFRYFWLAISILLVFSFFDSLISVWREMRTNSGLCFSQLLRYLYLACFSKFSYNFEYWRIFLMFLTRTLIFFKGFFLRLSIHVITMIA